MNKAKYVKVYNKNNRLDKNGKAPVNIAVYFNRNVRRFVSTGVSIEPGEWNERKRVVKKNKNAIRLNFEIDNLITKIEAFELEILNRKGEFGPAALERLLNKGTGDKYSFIRFGWEVIEELETELAYSTIQSYKSIWRRLEKFSPDLKFNQTTRAFIIDYNKHLKTEGYAKTSIKTINQTIRGIVNRALEMEPPMLERCPYVGLKIENHTNERQPLTQGELAAFENVVPDTLTRSIIKDMFLVSVYTGARYSDVIRLEKSLFTDKDSMSFEMKKTKKNVTLHLGVLFQGKALKILSKYDGDAPFFSVAPKLPHVERHLSLLAKSAGIKKHVTFHIARHTFGTTLADLSGDPFLVMSLMGHSNIDTTMRYFHDNPETRKKKLKKLEWD